MKKFLLIDDHAIVRSGIKFWLSAEYNPSKIDEAENGKQATEKIQDTDYDLLLLDIHMPETNSFDLLKYILNTKPDSKVLIFSMNSESMYAKRFLKAGAIGFVSKDAPIEELKKAVDLSLNNRKYFSDTFIESVLNEKIDKEYNNPFSNLSSREFEIANLLLEGKPVGEISVLLNIKNSTTATYKARIFEKLKIENVLQLNELAVLYEIKK
ncbi:MAG TPA: response regulator transcription factor [Chitinophagaceae bacterium]|nr:response regulator transcription factor [Chitinophagaceae bacterium]